MEIIMLLFTRNTHELHVFPIETHKKTLRSHSSSEVSETSMEQPDIDENTTNNNKEDESKPTLPSRKPGLGQSSLAQMAVLPIMTAVLVMKVCNNNMIKFRIPSKENDEQLSLI